MALGEGLFTGKIATVYYLTEEDIRLTWQVFRQFSEIGDKKILSTITDIGTLISSINNGG
jgi:hypothetical protein